MTVPLLLLFTGALSVVAALVSVTIGAALALVSFGTVAREERYLEGKFGDEYRRHQAGVPRWL